MTGTGGTGSVATRPGRVSVQEGGDDVPGWAGAVMRWLGVIARVIAVNLLTALGTTLGLVVLGVLPALGAADTVLSRMVAGDAPDSLWRSYWSAYRSQFRRLNRLGLPLLLTLLLLMADALALPTVASSAGTGPAAVLTAGLVMLSISTVVLGAWFLPVARRYDRSFGHTWRFLLLAPPTSPGVTLAVLVTLGAVALVSWYLPMLLPLVAVAVSVALTGVIIDRRLDRIDAAVTAS